MKAVMQTIRILVIIQVIIKARCQDGFNNGDILRYQQLASHDGQIEPITGYNSNVLQRDPSAQTVGSVSVQYHITDDANKNEEYNRVNRARSRKVYRIKNPFQHQAEDLERQVETESRDSGTGASNQYAAMQYSLPPEEFLQQMRAENQYFQQQVSTPAPSIGYTVTPQPQYQYSTMSPSNYDNSNQQTSQMQLEPKTHAQAYIPYSNNQYSSSKMSYSDNTQSTPSPINSYLSTPLPNNQFVVTPSNSYVSSSSPMFLSSPPNLQHYVSSPLSSIQASSPDYNNRASSTIVSINYDNNDQNKKMQIDHYDNSVNGIRYSINGLQNQNDYPSSTPSSFSSPYSNSISNVWQNSVNTGTSTNALSKSLQEVSLTPYQNYPYGNSQQDVKNDYISDNGYAQQIGSLPSANNVYFNIAQPDYQTLSSSKIQTRDTAQETGHPELYTNGDYGWKLTEQKSNNDNKYASSSYPGYPGLGSQSDGGAISHMNFQMGTSKPYNYDQIAKSSSDSARTQEFVKAAAKAHENFKQQQQQQILGNNYASFSFGTNQQTHTSNAPNSINDKQNNRYSDSSNSNLYSFSNAQGDLITASPFYYVNSKENSMDTKLKQPFDHARALKHIVPIDVSNVVSNANAQMKSLSGFESNNKYNIQNYGKEQTDQNMKENYRPVTESYYKDKNTIYGFNIKTKPDDFFTLESLKQLDQNDQYQGKQQQSQQQSNLNPFSFSGTSQSLGYTPSVSGQYQDNIQLPASFQQQSSQRPQNQVPSDITSILKLNDLPYRLSHGSTSEPFRLHNNDDKMIAPTPLPIKINQNLGSHQLDVTSSLLNKLILNNQPGFNGKPDIDSLSTINGFKVANPYNVDLSLVAEMLRGKSTIDDSHMLSLKDQYSKPSPLKLDLSQLQLLLRSEQNSGNLAMLNDGLSSLSSPYLDVYNSGRYPYQGVKYSRSQEEEESIIPIADTSNTHPIGAVMEQDDTANDREVSTGSDATAQGDESLADHFEESRTKKPLNSGHRTIKDRHRHPNALLSGRQSYHRKYPKTHFGEPYPLLKPPPHGSRSRDHHGKLESFHRRRRGNKPKVFRILKSEPLYEADGETENDSAMPIVLRPPPPEAESKSDVVDDEQTS